jgi:hypothetical protein
MVAAALLPPLLPVIDGFGARFLVPGFVAVGPA